MTTFNLSPWQNTCLFTDGNKASVCVSSDGWSDVLRRPIPNTATTEKLKLVCHSVQQDGGRDSGYSRAQDRKIRRSSAMARSGFGRDGTLRHLGLDAAAIARAPAHSARHCPADCDASPATDRRPPCRSLPVRACRLPACPASVFACLLRGQAGQLRPCPDATHRDVPWRVAGVRHYRNSIEEPSHRMAHSASACPAAESAQCEGRHHGGTMMMASRWDPAAPA